MMFGVRRRLVASAASVGLVAVGIVGLGSGSAVRALAGPTEDPGLLHGSLEPVGRLAGHRSPILLDRRSVTQPDGHVAVTVTARNARTGRALWARRIADADQAVFPAHVGPSGYRGLIFIAQYMSGSGSTTNFDDRIVAVGGRSGRVLWRTRFTGSTTFGSSTTTNNSPSVLRVVHAVAGRPDQVLVTLDTSDRTGGSTRAILVSGVDGTRHRVLRVASATGAPQVLPLPDETGDGLTDLFVAKHGKPGHIQLRHGDTGQLVWSTPGSAVYDDLTWAAAVGRVTGGSVPDLAVTGLEASPNSANGGPVSLVRGSDGQVMWTRDEDGYFSLAPRERARAAALGLVTQDYTAPAGSAAFNLSAVDAAGNVLFAKHLTLKASNSGVPSSGIEMAGDVEPDGAEDMHIVVYAGGGRADAVIGMSSGVIHRYRPGFQAPDGLQTKPGTDYIRSHRDRTGVVLAAVDGATGTVLYRRTLAHSQEFRNILLTGARITDHQCSDMVVVAATPTGFVKGLMTARGRWIWRITISASELFGGKRVVPAAPAHYCLPAT